MIRYAKKEDIEQINRLRKQVNDLHIAGRPDIFRNDHCKEFEDYAYKILEDDHSDLIAAFRDNNRPLGGFPENGLLCGFACVVYTEQPSNPYKNARKFCEISEIGVDSSFQRQKIGTELIDFIKEEARKKGFDKIELNMWEFNQNALKFYESIGFSTYRRYMEYNLL